MRRERAEHGAACSFEIGNRRDGGSASRSAERRGVRSGARGASACRVGLAGVSGGVASPCLLSIFAR